MHQLSPVDVMDYGIGKCNVGHSLVYNAYAVMSPDLLDGYAEARPIVKSIIREFLIGTKKVVGSFRVAKEVITQSYCTGGYIITDEDIQEAYDIACGGGFEYEWPYE